MIKEDKIIEYSAHVINLLKNEINPIDSTQISKKLIENNIKLSSSYFNKVLAKMVKVGLLVSNHKGYSLIKKYNEYTMNDLLKMCVPTIPTIFMGKYYKLLKTHAETIKLISLFEDDDDS